MMANPIGIWDGIKSNGKVCAGIGNGGKSRNERQLMNGMKALEALEGEWNMK
jgi:hypothetical protein